MFDASWKKTSATPQQNFTTVYRASDQCRGGRRGGKWLVRERNHLCLCPITARAVASQSSSSLEKHLAEACSALDLSAQAQTWPSSPLRSLSFPSWHKGAVLCTWTSEQSVGNYLKTKPLWARRWVFANRQFFLSIVGHCCVIFPMLKATFWNFPVVDLLWTIMILTDFLWTKTNRYFFYQILEMYS